MSVGAGLPAMRPVLTTQCWGGVRHGSKKQPFTMGRFRPKAAVEPKHNLLWERSSSTVT